MPIFLLATPFWVVGTQDACWLCSIISSLYLVKDASLLMWYFFSFYTLSIGTYG